MGQAFSAVINHIIKNIIIDQTFSVTNHIKKKINVEENKYKYQFQVLDSNILDNNQTFNKKRNNRKFKSKYSCGNSNVYKTINESEKQTVIYDCEKENDLCESSKLTLYDSGRLILRSGKNYETIRWSKSFKTGDVDETKKAVKGKNGKNFLLSNQILEPGEFIGSPSGNCYLEFEKIPTEDNSQINLNQLVVKYKISECNNTSNRVHNVEKVNKQHVNKIAYINEGGEKRFYPDSMTGLSNDYFYLGKSNSYSTDGKLMSLEECKNECNNYTNCYGVEHDIASNKCYLRKKNDILYSGDINSKKKINSVVDLYMRKKDIQNHNSCTKEIKEISIQQLNSIPETTMMTKNTICGLNESTIAQRKIMEEKQSYLNTIIDKVKLELPTLYKSNKTLHHNIVSQLNNNDNDLNQIKNINSMLNNKKINNPSLDGQTEDLIKNVNSERYYYILMIIISIIFIIMSIRLAK